eukprot:5080299-Prymnesium_polylepis.1
MIDATAFGKAKVVLPGIKNAGLSRVFGAGNWQKLFDDATPSILPAASQAAIRWSARGLRPRSRS